MFTGLVEDVGAVVATRPRGNGRLLQLRTRIPTAEIALGDSVAVNGVCLTAEGVEGDTFSAVAGAETVARSTLGALRVGSTVHLERALAVGDRLGGHWVQGHVDGVGRVVRVDPQSETWVIWLALPHALLRYVASKGSLCVDGVSLTVNEIVEDTVRLNVVPHTVSVTRLAGFRAGDLVNIEVDILAKYVERLLQGATEGGLSMDQLRRYGY